MSAHRRGGFTLVEVVAVVSILARIALPNVQEALIRARAAAAMGDVEVVRTAAANYYARNNAWPGEAPPGVVPAELLDDLPDEFSFDRGEYRLDWERWTLPNGLPEDTTPRILVGVLIATPDEMLGNAVAALIDNSGWYSLGHNSTFLIDGL